MDSSADSESASAASPRSDAARPSQAERSTEQPARKPVAISDRVMSTAKGAAKPWNIPPTGAQSNPGVAAFPAAVVAPAPNLATSTSARVRVPLPAATDQPAPTPQVVSNAPANTMAAEVLTVEVEPVAVASAFRLEPCET